MTKFAYDKLGELSYIELLWHFLNQYLVGCTAF